MKATRNTGEEGCKHVLIENDDIDAGDDAIAIKSGRGMEGLREGRTTEDVLITNCILGDSNFAGIGIGSETSGGIRNIRIEHVKFTHVKTYAIYIKLGPSAQLLMNGLRRSPGRQSLLMTFAQVVAEGGQKPVAGWVLQRVIASGAGSTQLRQNARDLLYSLDLTDTQRTAFGDFGILDSTEVGKGVSVRLSSTQVKAARKQAKRDGKEEKVVRGYLTNVDCSRGLTLYILS